MRTTLINTTFWKEDTIDELHLDSKLLYLYMLTNPDKGLANIYHYKKRVISAYSGLSVEQIEVASKQLVELGYIDIFKGYFILLKGHEMAKKGRFTDKTIEKEKQSIDEEVLEHFNLLIDNNSSGVAPEHKDKDNNNKDINITKENNIDKTAIKVEEALYASVQNNYPNLKIKKPKGSWAIDIEKIHRIDGYSWDQIIYVAGWSQRDDFWKQNIRSGSTLRKQFDKLLVKSQTVKGRVY